MSGGGSFLSGLAGGYLGAAGIDERKKTRQALENSSRSRGVLDQSSPDVPVPRSVVGTSELDPGFDPGQIDPSIAQGINESAAALGVDPIELATTISYETAGTFDATKKGPTTQHGQHRGFIQFGEPQAKQHGVDWNNPVASQLGENGAVVSYLRNAGVKPGMGLLDIYSAINAGGVGLYGRSDAHNGGAPGTVADKVNTQMSGHRQKAEALMGYYKPTADVRSSDPGKKTYERGIEGLMDRSKDLIDKFYNKKG